MKSSIQKPIFTGMVLNFLTVLILLSYGSAMDAPKTEFGAGDLVSLGIFSGQISNSGGSRRPGLAPPRPGAPPAAKGFNSVSSSTLTSSTTQRALLIATAKLSNGSPHGSVPFITVDVTQSTPGCGPFDWIFRPDCSAPRLNLRINAKTINGMNRVPLPNSILYVYDMPEGAENVRITLPNYSSCGRDGDNARTGTLRLWTQGNLCNRARFRKRHCRKRLIFFRKCSLRDCSTLVFVSRVVTIDANGTTTMPYIASGSGIETCPTSEIANLFLK